MNECVSVATETHLLSAVALAGQPCCRAGNCAQRNKAHRPAHSAAKQGGQRTARLLRLKQPRGKSIAARFEKFQTRRAAHVRGRPSSWVRTASEVKGGMLCSTHAWRSPRRRRDGPPATPPLVEYISPNRQNKEQHYSYSLTLVYYMHTVCMPFTLRNPTRSRRVSRVINSQCMSLAPKIPNLTSYVSCAACSQCMLLISKISIFTD